MKERMKMDRKACVAMDRAFPTGWILVLLFISASSGLKMETDPLDDILMGSEVNLTMRLIFDEATWEEAQWPKDRMVVVTLNTTDKRSWAVEILNNSLTFSFDQGRYSMQKCEILL